MGKIYKKSEWQNILKEVLIRAPEHDGEHIHEDYSREDIYITITSKGPKRSTYYSFGGPIWGAMIDFSDPNEIKISPRNPINNPKKITWKKVKSISITYSSE